MRRTTLTPDDPPAWLRRLLHRRCTRIEILCALCGRDLTNDEREAERQRREGDPYASDVGLPGTWAPDLEEAQRWVEEQLEAGHFATYTHQNATTGDYTIEGDEVFAAAVLRRDLFPLLPFTAAELPPPTVPSELVAARPSAPAPPATAPEGRKALVEGFLERVRIDTGQKIRKIDIHLVAGYQNDTEFMRWQRHETGKAYGDGEGVDVRIRRALNLSSEEFVRRLKSLPRPKT